LLPWINPAAGITAATASGKKLHEDEANHGITKSCHHPRQGDSEQEKRRQIGSACSKEVMASHSPAGGADYRL
jgi:hypothetical protein